MQVFNYRTVRAEEAELGSSKLRIRWLITQEIGAKNFSMRLFEMAPDGFSPLHEHPWEHAVFILKGEGLVTGGREARKFIEGDVIFIPANEKHQLKNTCGKVVQFICLIPNIHEEHDD